MENIRFFDDAEDLHVKYYPPFPIRIENRADLLAAPPDKLWIMSSTFGAKIYDKLKEGGFSAPTLLADEVFTENGKAEAHVLVR